MGLARMGLADCSQNAVFATLCKGPEGHRERQSRISGRRCCARGEVQATRCPMRKTGGRMKRRALCRTQEPRTRWCKSQESLPQRTMSEGNFREQHCGGGHDKCRSAQKARCCTDDAAPASPVRAMADTRTLKANTGASVGPTRYRPTVQDLSQSG